MNHQFLLAQKQLDNGMAEKAMQYYELDSEEDESDYAKKLAKCAFMIADAMFAEATTEEKQDE